MRLPAGTQDGKRSRCAGRGPRREGTGAGNLVVRVGVVVPKS